MITATVTAEKYVIKPAHLSKSMNNIRLIVPKKWDAEHVNVILWEESICTLKISNPEVTEFIIPDCGEIFLKKVIKDDKRHYIYLPVRYDGQQVPIVPV